MDHQSAVREKLAERYLLRELEGPERDSFEEHYFSCELCADDVRAAAQFIQGARAELTPRYHAPADHERSGWSAWFGWIWSPAPAYALALTLGVLMLIRQPADVSSVQVLSFVNLRPVTRGTPQLVRIAPGQRIIPVTVSVPAGASYECTFTSPAGVKQVFNVSAVPDGTISLALPASAAAGGRSLLLVRSRTAGVSFEDEFELTTEQHEH
jgi:hypothetical protein